MINNTSRDYNTYVPARPLSADAGDNCVQVAASSLEEGFDLTVVDGGYYVVSLISSSTTMMASINIQ